MSDERYRAPAATLSLNTYLGADDTMWTVGLGSSDSRWEAKAETRVACPKPVQRVPVTK